MSWVGNGLCIVMGLGRDKAPTATAIYMVRSSEHHQAREVLSELQDDLGATTRLSYQPLTNAAVYRRDPDLGTETWTYNAAGDVIAYRNGVGEEVLSHYDALGRLWQRVSGVASV